jgi:hypothetical protein
MSLRGGILRMNGWMPREGLRMNARPHCPPRRGRAARLPGIVASLAAVTASLSLAGCATGPRYVASSAAAAEVPDGMGRVTVYRPDSTLQYALRGMRLDYDGERAASLPHGSFVVMHVPAGAHVLRADLWDAPGECELNVVVPDGASVYVRAAPRAENFAASVPGLALASAPGASAATIAAGGAAMVGGMAAESAGRKCGGAFALRVVDPKVALPELPDLRSAH